MWTPQYFANDLDSLAKQVLPPKVYKARGVKGLRLIDNRLLEFIDQLRYDLGIPLTINGGGYTQSGLRDVDHYGSQEAMDKSWSTHKYGSAIDFRSPEMSSHEIRRHIIANKKRYPMITFMEVGISWVHVSTQTRITEEDILYWSPRLGYVSESVVIDDQL